MRELSLDFLQEDNFDQETGRCGIVALVGRANVGKSTLLNHIVDEKVSIVSPVAQTTRNIIRAILSEPRGQLVFLDTPGVHKAKYELNHLMNRMARTTTTGADAILLVLDGSQPPYEEDEGWMRRLCRESAMPVFAVNKCDTQPSHARQYQELWKRITAEKQSGHQPAWQLISARNGKGVDRLIDHLFELMPPSPYLFDQNILTDFPRKLAIADLVREKFLHLLRDEIPHSLAVEVTSIDEKPAGWQVKIDLIVKRAGQKGIVIGHKGKQLKKVKRTVERELGELHNLPVTLDLWVRIDPKWDRNHWILKRLGYSG